MVLQYWEEEDPFPTSTTVFNNIKKAPTSRVVWCAEIVARKSGAPVTEVTNAAPTP